MILRKKLELIHFGSNEFKDELFTPVINPDTPWIKPISGGLWASPVNSKWGWSDWCEENGFRDCEESNHFRFYVSGNCVQIDNEADLSSLQWIKSKYGRPGIDFEKMRGNGIDFIYLTGKGEQETRFSQPAPLYGWDCECALIILPACISPAIK